MNHSSYPHSSVLGQSYKSARAFLPILGLVIATATAVHANPINVAILGDTPGNSYTNTGNMSGAGVLASSSNSSATPDQWNILTKNAETIDLSDTSGHATGATLTTNFNGVGFTGHDSVNGFLPALFEQTLYTFTGSTASLDFANLTADTTYKLVLYVPNNNAGTDDTYTVNGNTSTLVESGHDGFYSQPTTNALDSDPVYTGNYIQLLGTTDASGSLNITLGLAPSNSSNNSGLSGTEFLAFNGLQIEAATATPEPSTFAFLAMGLLGLTFVAYRRRAAMPQA